MIGYVLPQTQLNCAGVNLASVAFVAVRRRHGVCGTLAESAGWEHLTWRRVSLKDTLRSTLRLQSNWFDHNYIAAKSTSLYFMTKSSLLVLKIFESTNGPRI